jgi:hypothetical protein
MRKLLFLSALALCAAPVAAADTAKCDAKPFTLGKPATAAPKADKPASNQQVKAEPVTKKPEPKAEAKAKPTLFAPCKDKAKKPA